jgi:hypothetical protein
VVNHHSSVQNCEVGCLEVSVNTKLIFYGSFYFCFLLVYLHLLASIVLRYVWCWGTQALSVVSNGQPYSGTSIL